MAVGTATESEGYPFDICRGTSKFLKNDVCFVPTKTEASVIRSIYLNSRPQSFESTSVTTAHITKASNF